MAIVISQPQLMQLGQLGNTDRQKPFKARLGRVRKWLAGQIGDTRHEHRVMQIAVGLFNLTAKRHRLEARHRRYLMLAALLHDVGRVHGASDHPINGARMVREDAALDLRPSERLVVGYLTRYHRGRMPNTHKKWRFEKLADARTMHLLLAMLRAADTLDSRNITTRAVAMRAKAGRIRIRCYVEDVRAAEKTFNRPKKFRPLEEMLGLRLAVRLRQADALSAA